jgi:DNA modification methylase
MSSDPFSVETTTEPSYRDKLIRLLERNLDFHDEASDYASHGFHSFPAKFPPQLPRCFIAGLTGPHDVILDPMVGSGTTIVEAFNLGRCAIGFDIDPLALLLTRTKTTPVKKSAVAESGRLIIDHARESTSHSSAGPLIKMRQSMDAETIAFIDYWFHKSTQIELAALMSEIREVSDHDVRNFMNTVFSGIIVTKSGGVSLALDLGHTRPHRARVIVGKGSQPADFNPGVTGRHATLRKILRSPIEEFERKLKGLLRALPENSGERHQPIIQEADAQCLPLSDGSVDLIVTSPPYASNAIDYMRAHKFSLVWFGYSINDLGTRRNTYIGGEATKAFRFEVLPEEVMVVIDRVSRKDDRKGLVLHRYYSEMYRVLTEIYRVLKPGKAAIVVVGNSVIRGVDSETQTSLARIGRDIGFDVPHIGIRILDRDRRMLPSAMKRSDSQIEKRMHSEHVIGLLKPS